MNPAAFQSTYLPQALTVESQTGIWRSALLCQWAVETAWGSAIYNANNLGNIRCSPTTFCQYSSLSEFCDAAIATWHNGNYSAVLYGAPISTPSETMVLIGQSPWDAGHYNNGEGPGSSLLAAYKELPMANTVGDLAQEWLSDVNARQASFLGIESGTTAPVTAPELLAAIKAIQPGGSNQDVLNAIANLQRDVTAIKTVTDKIGAILK